MAYCGLFSPASTRACVLPSWERAELMAAMAGVPGYLRIDTVHQGDWDGEKGLYHINAVDTVTQWEIVGCTPKISEQHLLPILEAMLHQFPFRILGFSFRQWLGVRQSSGGPSCSTSWRQSSPVPGPTTAPITPWWKARMGHHSQTSRLWIYRQPACRPDPVLLHRSFQSVAELPPSLWLCSNPLG